MHNVINVLVVDDSVFMRKLMADMLNEHPKIRVVGTARDGMDALNKVENLKIDVITMDYEMPGINGLETAKRIMSQYDIPIIMVSSLAHNGAQITIKALAEGVFDFCAKPDDGALRSINRIKTSLQEKVLIASRSTGDVSASSCHPSNDMADLASFASGLIAIGTSTGGPRALEAVLRRLPANTCPLLIVQHMPPKFTKSLAERLNRISQINVKEAINGELVKPGWAYVAPGDKHMLCKETNAGLIIALSDRAAIGGHKPSVDALFLSIAKTNIARNTVAVVLTGMGSDGCKGTESLKSQGAFVIVEDPETALIGGMPGAVVRSGHADEVLSLHLLGVRLAQICR